MIGQPVRRVEDPRLVSGGGAFVDDVALAGMARAWILRSPHAHAEIRALDAKRALDAPGVLTVLTGADYVADGLGTIPCTSLPPAIGPWRKTPFPALVADRVRAVGDAVAVVVAETAAQARDAADLIRVEYDPLPAVVGIAEALAADAPVLWSTSNVCFETELGDRARTDAAFARAAHVVELALVNGRVAGSPLEPRGYVGAYHARDRRYTLVTSTQNPHRIRQLLAEAIFKVPAHRIHVTAGDVGGGFGTKGGLYPEEALVLWAARRAGRPVKWISDRSEGFLADFHGRDQRCEGRMALDTDGRILGFRVVSSHNLGCQVGPSGGVSPLLCGRMFSGPYDMPAVHVTVRGVLTNTRTTTSYRGAGRPEAAFFVERMMDAAARALGVDPVELRRRNLIRAAQMPYRTALVDTYDSGDFAAVLERALALAEWDGFAARRRASEARGRRRGRGLAYYVEVSAIANERMEIRFDPTGHATVVAGTFSHGQGHETVYAQMVSDWLGLPLADIGLLQGDTDQVSYGRGTYGSRSITVGGSALRYAADQIVDRGRRIAAHLLEAAADDVEFARGAFTVRGTDRSIALSQVARASYAQPGVPVHLGVGLEGVGYFAPQPPNYPNGCHVVEVEVDPDTGATTVDRYTVVDDVGVVINPLLLGGQVHGGIAQGAGQALTERMIYDEAGQLLTGSFMDYAMPRADDLPEPRMASHPVPTATNPLGVKGGGEIGTVGAAPAIVQAIVDALAPLGVRDVEMPATPYAVWSAIEQAWRHQTTDAQPSAHGQGGRR